MAARARDLLASEPLSPPERPRRLSAIALRAAAVIGLAAAMTAAVITVGGNELTSPPADAAELLRYAAAASAKDPRPQPGQFVYQDRKDVTWGIIIEQGGRHEHTQEVRKEIWTPISDPGKALARLTYGIAKSTSDHVPRPAGKVEYQRVGHCTASPTATRAIGEQPTDPQRLLGGIRDDVTAAASAEQPPLPSHDPRHRSIERSVTMRLVKLAQDPLAGSQLRATVFQAMSQLPTATMVPDLADSAGRRGLGVSVRYQGRDGWEREELVFEPETYRFLGWRSWTPTTHADGSTTEVMSGSTAVLTTKTVDAMPKVPEDAISSTSC